ncbi:MAG: TIGR03619 family F420-dependent LLM class oxidoreductase [Actinomycetota bacterium]|nr:TIGR03619 family F420-dependent LLM class oxidoreductase [Actinomycetota bacterium]
MSLNLDNVPPRMVSVLTENWTLTDPRDLPALVRMAQEAEDAGFDMVMVSDHVVMGPSAGSSGRMENPRDYAMPGNQDPATPWPSSLILLAAIAAATTRIRIGAVALIAPLRHPLALAKDLATLDLLSGGRLVVQPTVSWHEDEFAALGVDFRSRGKILDEHLQIWQRAWQPSPASFTGEFFAFHDVYVDPKPSSAAGPTLWFGGQGVSSPIVRRLAEYGSGYHPLGRIDSEHMQSLRHALEPYSRAPEEFELVGGTRVEFPSPHECAPLEPALEEIPRQMALGLTTFCIKPSIFIDDPAAHPSFCREVVKRVDQFAS